MILLFMRFYYLSNRKVDKVPIKAVRREGAFINTTVPRAVALPTFKVGKKTVGKTKPTKKYWNGARLKRLVMFTYPNINEQQWFTYKKVKGGKVKRVTLYQFMKKGDHK